MKSLDSVIHWGTVDYLLSHPFLFSFSKAGGQGRGGGWISQDSKLLCQRIAIPSLSCSRVWSCDLGTLKKRRDIPSLVLFIFYLECS